jgi:hypothetical protein
MATPERSTPTGQSNNWRPIPDPTELTADAVDAAKEEVRREIHFVRELLQARLDAADRAVVLLQDGHDRMPGHITTQVEHLRALIVQRFETTDEKFRTSDERFRSIQTQFSERDTRTEQTSRDGKVAIDAALAAQSASVNKQNEANTIATAKAEDAFMRQIEQQRLLLDQTNRALNDKIDTANEALNSKIDNLKELLYRGEGRGAGMKDSWGIIVAAIATAGVLFAIWHTKP